MKKRLFSNLDNSSLLSHSSDPNSAPWTRHSFEFHIFFSLLPFKSNSWSSSGVLGLAVGGQSGLGARFSTASIGCTPDSLVHLSTL